MSWHSLFFYNPIHKSLFFSSIWNPLKFWRLRQSRGIFFINISLCPVQIWQPLKHDKFLFLIRALFSGKYCSIWQTSACIPCRHCIVSLQLQYDFNLLKTTLLWQITLQHLLNVKIFFLFFLSYSLVYHCFRAREPDINIFFRKRIVI